MERLDESDLLNLAAPGVRGLQPYQPGKPIDELQRELGIESVVKLASNENPLGPGPRAMAALRSCAAESSRYPDGNGFALKQALSQRHRIDPACITLGNGSNDVLDLVARTFLAPGVEAVFSEYAFVVYPISTQATGATACVAPAHDGSRGPRYGHDLVAMAQRIGSNTRVVFIANPNNPTGTWLGHDELERFLNNVPPQVLVVVDEAYFEYVQVPGYPDSTAWLARFPNLLVTRTFSKAYGLAGLRVGYGLSSPEVAELLNRVRQPFNVSIPALAAARAALEDQDYIERSVRANREGMQLVQKALQSMELECTPSAGNFLLVGFHRPAMEIYAALLQQGVIVRPVANYGLDEHLRITVGTAGENERLVTALQKVL